MDTGSTVLVVVLVIFVLFALVKLLMGKGASASATSTQNEGLPQTHWPENQTNTPVFQESYLGNNGYGQNNLHTSHQAHHDTIHTPHTDSAIDQSTVEHGNASYTDSSSFSDSYTDSSTDSSSSSDSSSSDSSSSSD